MWDFADESADFFSTDLVPTDFAMQFSFDPIFPADRSFVYDDIGAPNNEEIEKAEAAYPTVANVHAMYWGRPRRRDDWHWLFDLLGMFWKRGSCYQKSLLTFMLVWLLSMVQSVDASPPTAWGTRLLPQRITANTPIYSRAMTALSGTSGAISVLGILSRKRNVPSNIAVMSGLSASMLSFTWLVSLQDERPTITVKETLGDTVYLTLLIGISVFTVLFAGIHYIRLTRVQRIRELAARSQTTTHIFRLQDVYVLRIIVVMVWGSGTVIWGHQGEMTQHIALSWLPPILSAATILPAAWEGRESPIEFQPTSDV